MAPFSTMHNIWTDFFFLPLSPRPPWCLSYSGARECVWDSETAFPPPPNHTLTGPFEHDERGEVEEECVLIIFPAAKIRYENSCQAGHSALCCKIK